MARSNITILRRSGTSPYDLIERRERDKTLGTLLMAGLAAAVEPLLPDEPAWATF
jgi:hypothetical protein